MKYETVVMRHQKDPIGYEGLSKCIKCATLPDLPTVQVEISEGEKPGLLVRDSKNLLESDF